MKKQKQKTKKKTISLPNHLGGLTDADVVVGKGLHVFTRVLGRTRGLAERQGDQTKED